MSESPCDKKISTQFFLSGLLKIVLTCLALYFISKAVDIENTIEILKKIDIIYFILFLLISYPLIWVSTKKWSLFIPATAVCPEFNQMMKMYVVSYFANLFLPSSIGGDAVRSLSLGKYISDNVSALLATFFERYTGLITLVFVSLLGSIYGGFSNDRIIALNLIILLFLVFGFFVFARGIFASSFSNLLSKLPLPIKIRSLFTSLLNRRLDGILCFNFLAKVFLLSLLFYILTVVNIFLGLNALSYNQVFFFDLMCVVPVILFISMLPLTPGSIGIQEGAYVYFLTKIGVPADDGLALAVLIRLKGLLLAGLGWYYYVRSSHVR